MNNNYENKYLKYKQKYFQLLNGQQKGGSQVLTNIKNKINSNNDEKIKAKDDAVKLHLTPIEEILSGRKIMAFNHVQFLIDMFVKYNLDNLIPRAQLLLKCSIFRNMMITTSVNDIFVRINKHNNNNNLKLKVITPEMNTIYTQKSNLIQEASQLGVNIDGYIEFSDAIITDIAGCSNKWNQIQSTTPGNAADCVLIIKDTDDKLYLFSIERGFSPGKNNIAFPGGFVDVTDKNMTGSALRELEEETGLELSDLDSQIGSLEQFDLPRQEQTYAWDPRGKFPVGMNIGGVGLLYTISKTKRTPDEKEEQGRKK